MNWSMSLRSPWGGAAMIVFLTGLEGASFAQARPAPDQTPRDLPPAAPSTAPGEQSPPVPGASASAPPNPPPSPTGIPVSVPAPTEPALPPSASAEEKPSEPFAFGDFTWLNGSNRQHKALLDSPIFTGSFLLDVNYTASQSMPIDNTVVGSTALSRNNEITMAFIGFGGDFHYEHARGRLMTQFGVRSELVPRNDFSTFRGQFDLQNALRYISEANGGYHWDAMHGINLDGGIFMSYVGLFSYDNFENWMYLPSFTSDNTPWFFNGLRLQMFPSDKLKIEPWLINGWQTYGKFNEMPGVGFQVLWRPVDWFSVLSNGYFGWDNQDLPGVWRWHSDNSATISYYHQPKGLITRIASSYTFDIGSQEGNGLSFGGSAAEGHCSSSDPCPSRFVSGMMYHRVWFGDMFAFTVGGGFMTNPSRYLVLAPTGNASPIPQPESTQGVQYVAPSSPYDFAPGARFNAWDYEFGIQYMPIENYTLDIEWNHREADVPYFAGHGGVTNPDGYITTTTPPGWRPDLVKSDSRIIVGWLVRF